jgi:hypothetical protein
LHLISRFCRNELSSILNSKMVSEHLQDLLYHPLFTLKISSSKCENKLGWKQTGKHWSIATQIAIQTANNLNMLKIYGVVGQKVGRSNCPQSSTCFPSQIYIIQLLCISQFCLTHSSLFVISWLANSISPS